MINMNDTWICAYQGGSGTIRHMGAFFVMLFVLAVGPLALLYGADSRRWDERGGWPSPHRKH